jgi:hypothetical protein
VLPWETRRARDDRRARRRINLTALEVLEGRQLLSYSSLGYSLPDVSITGQAGPVAAWGGTLTAKVTLTNTGASTIEEPLSLTPTTQVFTGPDGRSVPPYYVPSSADAGTVPIAAYLTPRPHSLAGAILLGTFLSPSLAQNNLEQFSELFGLPQRPSNLPATGIYYVRLIANPGRTLIESNYTNDASPPIPVRFVSSALPMLRVTALDVPPVMQPGDTIAPTIQITNLGSASTAPQGPVQVALVASTTPDFNLGSKIIATFTLPNAIPAQSAAPIVANAHHHTRLFGGKLQNNNVTQGSNVETFTTAAGTLPSSPSVYFLGIVVDPNNKLVQLSLPANRLEQIHQVGPATSGLPPAGVVSATALSQQFPNPPDGVAIGNVNPGNF